jgi:uncharacterized membrane protein YeaQ/YmgE (transglycosylase-associated protein family)
MAATFFWIVLGVLVAGIVKFVAWDNTPVSWAPVLLIGVVGGVLGGYVRNTMWTRASDAPGFDPLTMLAAIVGTALLLYVFHVAYARKQVETISHRKLERAA